MRGAKIILAAGILATAMDPRAQDGPYKRSVPAVPIVAPLPPSPPETARMAKPPTVTVELAVDARGRVTDVKTTDIHPKSKLDAVFKEAAVTERLRIQFRTEFFNLTNTPTFLLPSSNSPGMTCMGRAPGTACNDTNPQFGKLSNSSTTGRQIQFGLKVIF